jgi:hypothetical protein
MLGHWVALSVLAELVRMLVLGGWGGVRPDGLGPLEGPASPPDRLPVLPGTSSGGGRVCGSADALPLRISQHIGGCGVSCADVDAPREVGRGDVHLDSLRLSDVVEDELGLDARELESGVDPLRGPPDGAIRHATRKQARGTSVWVPPGPAFADGHALSSVHASTRRVKNPCGRSGTAPRLCKSGVPSKPRPDKGTQGKQSVKDKSATAWHDHTHHDDLGAEVDSFLERVSFEASTGTDPHQIGLDMLYSQITELNRCGSAACNRSSVHKCRVTSKCAVCLVRWCEYACAGRWRRWTKEITQIVRWARSNFSRVFNEQ